MRSLVIDSRERQLCECLANLNIPFTPQNLLVGDIAIVEREQPEDEDGTVLCIFERKTVPDLVASIIDKRMDDQRARLEQLNVPFRIIYEGPLPTRALPIPIPSIIALMATPHCVRTTSTVETSWWLTAMLSHAWSRERAPQTVEPSREQLSTKRVFGKQSGDEAVCSAHTFWVAALTRVPRVTLQTAKVIAEEFPTCADAVVAVSKDPAHVARAISNMRPAPGKRRLGDKLASKLVEYLRPKE